MGRAAGTADLQVMIKTYTYLETLVHTLRRRESGQTMAEYAVVLAVIVVAIIVTLGLLAGGIKNTLSSVTGKL
jgi:Flp pilus assembly pilin Flp